MATATLRGLNSYRTVGKVFHKGKPVPVTREQAETLEASGRFHINWRAGERETAALEAGAVDVETRDESKAADRSRKDEETPGKGHRRSRPKEGENDRPDDLSERVAAIQAANDAIDPDDEEAFGANGKPTHDALTEVLGWSPTDADMKAAFADPAPTTKEQERVQRRSGGVKIVRRDKAEDKAEDRDSEKSEDPVDI